MQVYNFIKTFLAKRKIRHLVRDVTGPIKLNVGCGTDYKEGWINIDNNSDNNISRLDLNWDLRNSLPFADESVDFIFNEHFWEHLTVEESQKSLRDFMRVLKKGGVLRIATPDLDFAVELYRNPNWKEHSFISNFGLGFIETKAELLNMCFSSWGHKWLYDWEELKRRLTEAGCEKVKKRTLSKSQHKELRNLETREESTLIAEVTK